MAGTLQYLSDFRMSAANSGDSWNRPFRINGLLNGPDEASLIVEAYALVPDKNTAVPAPLVGMYVDDAVVESFFRERDATGAPTNSWGCFGSVLYRSPSFSVPTITVPDSNGPGVTVSTSVTVEEFETDVDIDDNAIETSYDNVTMGHYVRGFRTLKTHVFVRPEDANPRSRRDTYQGTRNAGTWNGYADGTVLLQSISDTTNDNQSWEVEYVFIWRSDGWGQVVTHEDPFFPGHPLPQSILSAPELAAARKEIFTTTTTSWAGLNITL